MNWKLFFTIVLAGLCVYAVIRLFETPLAIGSSFSKRKIGFGREDERD
jgi:hypothetical protein